MVADFNREQFLSQLETAVKEKDAAAQLGDVLGQKSFNRLYFVGCGGPNRSSLIQEYWAKRYSKNLDIRRYFPAEFIHQDPASLDENTLVILGSHSGTTPETVDAAKFLKDKPCTTVAITQKGDSPLAQNAQHVLLYGESDAGWHARFILAQALVSGFLNQKEECWDLHEPLMTSLDALPGALADATEASEARTAEEARLYKDDRIMYIVGAGPMFSTAYVIGVCILLEMQWMHVHPVVAAEYFHGPFEVLDETLPMILLVGEDPSRPEAERVVKFCKRYTERLMIYDSKDYEMKGIAPEIRGMVAPLILEAGLYRFAQRLAVWHNHPLSTRRYMWKVEY